MTTVVEKDGTEIVKSEGSQLVKTQALQDDNLAPRDRHAYPLDDSMQLLNIKRYCI